MTELPNISMKIHAVGERLILAACDKEIIGRTFVEGELQFKVSEYFYGGDLVNEETFLNMVKQVKSANIVGNLCVGLLIKAGIVESSSVLKIDTIQHIQLYDLSDLG